MNEQILRRPTFGEKLVGFPLARPDRGENLEDQRGADDPDLMQILSAVLASFFRGDAMDSANRVHADKLGGVPDLKPKWWDYTPEEMEQYRREIEENEAIRNGQVDFWRYEGED